MKPKFILFYFIFSIFILFSSQVLAASIAVSPNIIQLNSESQDSSFILLNPNNQEINYKISTSNNNIQVQDKTGTLQANSNKEISFTTNQIKKEEYIIAEFNSENTISPSITIKVSPSQLSQTTKSKQTTIAKNQNKNNQQNDLITANAVLEKNSINKNTQDNFFDETTIFLSITIFVLLLTIIFTKTTNKKYCTGHTGQKLRMFIKKFAH